MQKIHKFSPPLLLTSLLLTGCFEDEAKSCLALSQDESKKPLAFSVCEKVALDGNSEAQLVLANLLLTNDDAADDEKAVKFLEKSANQKNAQAIYQLGTLYLAGRAVEASEEKAEFYFQAACKLDEIKACEQLHSLKAAQEKQDKQAELALEKAKVDALNAEAKKAEAEARAQAAKQLAQEQAEQARLRKEEADRVKAKVGNRKFYYGLAKYNEGNLWGHINQKGEVVIPLQFAYAADFYDGLAAVKTSDGRWGYIDTKGNYQIQPQFRCVVYFSEGLAAASLTGYGENCQNGKWGFIDKSGRWAIQPIFDKVDAVFKNGTAKVTYQGSSGYIDKSGQWVDNSVNQQNSQQTYNQTARQTYQSSSSVITPKQIESAYTSYIKRYNSQGRDGVVKWVVECYNKSSNLLGCYQFDQLAAMMDAAGGTGSYEPYLSQSEVERRARKYVPELQHLSESDFRYWMQSTQNALANSASQYLSRYAY